MILYDYFSVFYLILAHFQYFPLMENLFDHLFMLITYCVGAGISILISISNWSDPYIFRPKMETTWSVKEKMEGSLFISRHSRHISFVFIMIKVLFPTLYFCLARKQLCFPPRKRYK